jgi:hypothetical protein
VGEEDVSGQPPDAPPRNPLALFPERLELLLLDALGLAAVARQTFLGRGSTSDEALHRLVVTGGALELGILEIQVCLVRKRDWLEDLPVNNQAPRPPAAAMATGTTAVPKRFTAFLRSCAPVPLMRMTSQEPCRTF